MKRCWLHIGMHKTGSSSVQQNLSRIKNAANWRLLEIGGRPNMGVALNAMFAPNPATCPWFVKTGESLDQILQKGESWRAELRETIQNLCIENIIISAEALSSFSEEGVVSMKNFLEPLVDEIRVIGYVRSPAAFKISRFQENIKQGASTFNIGAVKPNYQQRFEKYDRIFGRSNVVLRKFDPASFKNRCAVADFCEQIGITFPKDIKIKRVNESLSREAGGILYAYRKFGPGYGVGPNVIKENLKLIKPLVAMSGTKFKLAKEILLPSLDRQAEDIRWMEQRLGVSLEEPNQIDGTEITSEEDLLAVSRASCLEFVKCFTDIYKMQIPANLIPAEDPAGPENVSKLVEFCRNLIHNNMTQSQKTQNAPFSLKRFHRVLLKRIRRLSGLLRS
ncbi:MAG: hypothetical protein HC845_06010 [Akkermansiaceae bacterium]|nr:hypothetical protein [Akkermansiaceae bacterium]